MKEFAAFKALIALLTEHKKEHLLEETYKRCKAEELKPVEDMINQVQALYAEFTYDQVSDKIGEILTPDYLNIELKVIYQTVEDLHQACPNNQGDWYFSGNYPTVGGTRVVNRSFINYYENNNDRAY